MIKYKSKSFVGGFSTNAADGGIIVSGDVANQDKEVVRLHHFSISVGSRGGDESNVNKFVLIDAPIRKTSTIGPDASFTLFPNFDTGEPGFLLDPVLGGVIGFASDLTADAVSNQGKFVYDGPPLDFLYGPVVVLQPVGADIATLVAVNFVYEVVKLSREEYSEYLISKRVNLDVLKQVFDI